MSCNSFYSNPRSVKSIEYLKLLFISISSSLVALEREIFKPTIDCLMSEKIEPKRACYNSLSIKICRASCKPVKGRIVTLTYF